MRKQRSRTPLTHASPAFEPVGGVRVPPDAPESSSFSGCVSEAVGLTDKRTVREFDKLCLTPVHPLKPKESRPLHLRVGASPAVFARYLNVTTGPLSQWERGKKRPQWASLKLLSFVARSGLKSVA